MNIKEFSTEIADRVAKEMGHEYVMHITEVSKNNGIVLHGLNILNRQVNLSPCIYLEYYHEKYEHGAMAMDAIVEDIIKVYREHAVSKNWDTSSFTNYENAKQRLRGRLINTEKNEELLKTLPHREFLDLSLIYTVNYPCEKTGGMGSIRVTHDHVKMWKVDEEELFRQTKENMERYDESSLENLQNLLGEMIGTNETVFNDEEMIPMYILTNKEKLNGAVQMMNEGVLKATAEMLGKDLMIIPSSVHEVLLIPSEGHETEADTLRQMVREVNDTQLALNEILSYHVYRYSHQTGKIAIAA